VTAVFGVWGEGGRQLAWPLLQLAARRQWGYQVLPCVERSPRGKPLFIGHTDRWFSLSHSGGYALCALSDWPVGVDIEVVRPHRAGLPAYVLGEEELAAFDGSWEDFFRIWTLKESWCKQWDLPLVPPRAVATPPPCPHRSYAGDGWQGAVCCQDDPPREVIWLTPEEILKES